MTFESYFEKLNNEYNLLIKDKQTNVLTNVVVDEKEFEVLKIAVEHNHGILNLLSNKDAIFSLYKKGLINISDNNYFIVKDSIISIFKKNSNSDLNIKNSTMDNLINMVNSFKNKVALFYAV